MEEHGSGGHHLINFVTLFQKLSHDALPWSFFANYLNVFFSFFVIAIIGAVVWASTRNAGIIPSKAQLVCETIVSGLENFVMGILGPGGRKHAPFIGTLFIYIWLMNMMGIIPLMHAPTTGINTTVALALVVFLYVQFLAFKNFGLMGYLDHLSGSPRSMLSFILVPLMLVIHVVGEFAKPMSLCLRLACNITGEDTLIAVFVSMGVEALEMLPFPIGIPYHIPFIFLSLLLGSIQAFVFPLLTTVYIAMVSHHEEEHGQTAHE